MFRARFGQSFPSLGEQASAAPGMVCSDMKRVVDMSEVLGTVELPEGQAELCAAADAKFDETARRLVVILSTFLRPSGFLAKERHFRVHWLPRDETITESVAREECHALAREIFHRWVCKVREAAPQLHHA